MQTKVSPKERQIERKKLIGTKEQKRPLKMHKEKVVGQRESKKRGKYQLSKRIKLGTF